MKKIIFLLLWNLIGTVSEGQITQRNLDFQFVGTTLSGVLNVPEQGTVKGIVLIVHGSGRTNALEQNWHADVRGAILRAGYATYMWDKMGCGKSGGTFDPHQLVESSAAEVIAAIRLLKEKEIPGSDRIGLWGISRAGWINPIVINQHPDIQFWISVSGVDDKENFLYLYEENLKIHGVPDDTVAILSHELEQGYRISHAGKSFSTYLAATKNLRRDPWLDRFNNGRKTTEADYAAYQKGFRKEAFDSVSGLQIYVEDFAALLSNIHCPVLALFGEKDKNVDWRKTKKLYERTMGEKTNLQIQSFPDGNHNLFKCKTGGFYEFEDDGLPYHRCDGFLDVITNWLNALE